MKIKKIIRNYDTAHTYDIEVKEEHSYLLKTNSRPIIVHNSALCTNTPNGVERPRSKVIIKTNKSKDTPVVTPNFWKWKYEYAFDNKDNQEHLKMMAVMQKFICMSISTNLYYNYSFYENGIIPSSVIDKDLFLAYQLGLKTIYYTNTDDGNKHGLEDEDSGCAGGACKL